MQNNGYAEWNVTKFVDEREREREGEGEKERRVGAKMSR